MITLNLTFWITVKLFSKVAIPFYIPLVTYEYSNFSAFSLTLVTVLFFFFLNFSPLVKYEVVTQSDFDLHIPKSWLIGKDSDAGRDWGQEEKETPEDEMAGWHHRLDGREFQWTPGVGDGQGGLACCDSWGRKESDTTERLHWTELND